MKSKHTKKNHKEIINSIKKNKKNLKSLKQELKSINNKINTYCDNHKNLQEKELEQKMLLLDRKQIIEKNIELMNSDDMLHSFLLNNSKELFNIDNKKKMIDKNSLKNNNVLQYFSKDVKKTKVSTTIEKKNFNNR